MLIGRLDNIVALAYGTIAQMIDVNSGAPDWSRSALFSIEAEAADPAATTEAQLLAMLQTLLADRFKLKLHRETREVDGLALLVSKKGAKLKPANPAEDQRVTRAVSRSRIELTCQRISMSRLATILTAGTQLGRVVDRTNLSGEFDFKLMSDEDAGVPIFDAIEDQLGLTLQEQKVSMDFLVIDAAEKPLAN